MHAENEPKYRDLKVVNKHSLKKIMIETFPKGWGGAVA